MLAARLPDARLDQVADPRGERGQRWKLATLLRAILVAMVAGCKSLAQVEALTAEMALAVRRRLAIARRIADTTLRDALCTLDPTEVRRVLHALVRAAYRRKALAPDKLPFGVVALDGTSTVLPSCDDAIAQRQTQGEGGRLCGVLRTLTCTLISSPAMPCIDALPIPASTNEMGYFETALRSLVATYGGLDLFRMVTYDAGACSEHNGRVACALGVHYLFGLKGTQPTLFAEAQRLLAPLSPTSVAAFSTDAVSGHQVVRRLYLTEQMAGFGDGPHLCTVLRVEAEKLDAKGQRLAHEDRYFVSSLPASRLSPKQWLLLVRLHWGIENNCHHTLDTVFEEDDRPWIKSEPRGALVVALLRRVADNLVTLFRSVTQRSAERRATPWRDILRWFRNALLVATDADVDLRARPQPQTALGP